MEAVAGPAWLRWKTGLFVLFGCLLGFGAAAQTQTPVQQYGLLRVNGNRIVDKNSQLIRLAGNSLFWSNDGWGGEK